MAPPVRTSEPYHPRIERQGAWQPGEILFKSHRVTVVEAPEAGL